MSTPAASGATSRPLSIPAVEHAFTGPAYTVGIEEELMIVDAETLDLSNSIDAMLESPPGGPGHVQAELMESVLEVATTPCPDVPTAGQQLRALRQGVSATARERGLAIGSAGTHPFALWEEQRIVPRDRYRGLVAELGFVARQELIFGMHVHVGVDDPDKAIYVANALRGHVPLLIGLGANSPFWRADEHRARLQPHADLPGLPAGRAPARATATSPTTPSASTSWSARA